MATPSRPAAPAGGALVRVLRAFGKVEPAESVTVLLLATNLFVLLAGYYVLKTVREPLILAGGGAELKSYAAAFQAASLLVFVPAFSWLTSRLDRARLVLVMFLVHVATVELFVLGSVLGVPHLGFAFFVWVGIFSNASVALFWSYANDLHGQEAGERLFPVIAIGAALGGPVGSKLAEWLFESGVSPYRLLHVGAALLVVHLALYQVVDLRERRRRRALPSGPPLRRGPGGFGLVLRSPYLRLVAALLVLLNVVNTLGEYVLSRSVVESARSAAAADPSLDVPTYIGAFYGRYFFWVNVISVLLQAFVASRLVRRLGLAGVLLALPVVALGAYGLVAAGVGLAAIRWAKTAENAVDYSIMNTGKQLLWLPTRREEKYSAKQAVDTFFVRTGDLLAAAVVFAGTTWLGAKITGFGAANLLLVLAWGATAVAVLRRYRTLVAEHGGPGETATPPSAAPPRSRSP
jgi:AAA family ATP:ADP antiporter